MMDDRQEQFARECLAELRREMEQVRGPERIRPAVMDAFRAAHPRPDRKRWGMWIPAGVAAAAAVLAAVFAIPRDALPPPVPPVVKAALPPPAPVKKAEAPAQRDVAGARPKLQRRTARPVPVAPEPSPPMSQPAELATDFFPLPFAPPLTPDEAAEVVRVRLPRSAMRTVGLPVSGERMFDRVPADVLLGQDGVARAVRFVKLAQ